MKKDILESKHFNDWREAKAQCDRLENIITERLSYVVHKIFEVFNLKVSTWYFPDAKEGEVGDLDSHIWDAGIHEIFVEISNNKKNNIILIDKYDNEWEWDSPLPTRWLFEDFEREIIEGKKKYEEKEAARKAQRKELTEKQKSEDAALLANVKQKLSKKELAALRRSL